MIGENSFTQAEGSQRSLWIVRGTLAAALSALFWAIFSTAATTTDFVWHAELSQRIASGADNGATTHILYHLLVIAAGYILPAASIATHAAIPVTLASVILGLFLFEHLRNIAQQSLPDAALGLLALSLVTITPIFTVLNLPFLVGYLNLTIYHNPTQNILKLFVIPVTLLAYRGLFPQAYKTRTQHLLLVLIASILTMLMGLSKPSYTIVLLPALGLFALYRLLRRNPIDFRLLGAGIILPALFLLGLQFLGQYASTNDSSIAFGFLVFITQHLTLDEIVPRFLLSIVFPLVVYALYWQQAIRSPFLNFAWLIFGISAFYMYFLYETGARIGHGNFGWGTYIALFVLFHASVVFLLGMWREQRADRRLWIVGIVYGLHVLSGVRYIVAFLQDINELI